MSFCQRFGSSLNPNIHWHVIVPDAVFHSIKDTDQVRLMTPVQFLARLAALVPPPRHPLVRFYGVWAPHSLA